MHYSNELIKHKQLFDDHNLLVNQAGDFVFMNNKNLSDFQLNKLKKLDCIWLEHAGLLQNFNGDFFSTKNSSEPFFLSGSNAFFTELQLFNNKNRAVKKKKFLYFLINIMIFFIK